MQLTALSNAFVESFNGKFREYCLPPRRDASIGASKTARVCRERRVMCCLPRISDGQ
jgi:hypothetical protein